MTNFQKNFIYLSQIINIPVVDLNTKKIIGRTVDIVAGLREMFPRVSALIMRGKSQKDRYYIPWKNIRKIESHKQIVIENCEEITQQELKISESEILLKETFLDKQVVDIAGSKVVRVNDLHLLKEDLNLWVVHMDVGITGLIRRLGWTRLINLIIKLVCSYELKDRLISWKFVQPVNASIGADSLSLKVHHSKLSELHPADLAEIFVELGNEERMAILKSLDDETVAQTFQELPLKVRLQIFQLIEQNKLINILNQMAIDEAVDFLSELLPKKANALLAQFPKEKANQIKDLIGHSQKTAGSIMNTEYICAKQYETAGSIIEKIKEKSKKTESIYYVYVLDDHEAIQGVLTLRQLLSEQPGKNVAEIMRKRVVKVKVDAHVKSVAEIFYKYDFTAVPVVDKNNKIVGIIMIKDAFKSVLSEFKEEKEEAK